MAFANDIHNAVSGVTLAHRFAGLRAQMADRVARYRLYRETLNELSLLSDRELSDLGMGRCDIRNIARQAADRA
nr:DUF1127 domain-containing protein [Rubellimicrobium arenae]